MGAYDDDAMTLTVATDGAELTIAAAIKPEIREVADVETPADYEPVAMGLLPADDEFIVTAGGLEGQRGCFSRDASGAVAGIDLGGRLFGRAPTPAE